MTNGQKWIMRWVRQNFKSGSVRCSLEGDHNVIVTDKNGEQWKLTVNVYGDIMDADKSKIIAKSNCPHKSEELLKKPFVEPTEWTNIPQ